MSGQGATEKSSLAHPRGRTPLEALNFFMADMQAGIGPFLGIFLAAHGWKPGPIGTVMTLGASPALSSPRRRGR